MSSVVPSRLNRPSKIEEGAVSTVGVRRAVLYCRLSRAADTDAEGLDAQEAELRRLASDQGWLIVEVIREAGSAFSNEGGRPGFARLVSLVRGGACDVVAARHPDRYSRDSLEASLFQRDCAKHRVAMWTSAGPIDVASAQGELLATITSAVGQYESRIKAERLKLKHSWLAAEGRVSGGGSLRPYGYEADRLTVVPGEAAVIRDVARRLLAGESLKGEVRRLNDADVPTVSGAAWTPTVLSRLMRSGRISGRREHHGSITATAVWPPIITVAESDELRQLLDPSRRRHRAPRSYLLTGLLVCSECGTRLSARPRSDGARSYCCAKDHGGCGQRRVLAEPVEAWVAERLIERLDGDALARLVADDGSDASERDGVVAELNELADRRSVLVAQFAEGLLPVAPYKAALEALEARETAIRPQVARRPRRGALVALDGPLAELWPAMGLERRRAVLDASMTSIAVRPGRRGYNRFDSSRFTIDWL